MAHPRSLLAPLSRVTIPSITCSRSQLPRIAPLPYQTIRGAKVATQKKKKARTTFLQYDLKATEQFALVDAMRYIRAFEVGQNPSSAKYELHIRLKTLKNGAVIRNRLRLPHAIKTDIAICVIAAPDSKAAAEARAAGATIVGEEEIFAQIREGVINFERCLCHIDSLPKLNQAKLGRLLGPKGLMPSAKAGTVVTNVGTAVRNMVGASEYRERMGVIRLAIGQLAFTPEELQTNVKAFMDALKKDMTQISERTAKSLHEVVLSSTHAPGFTLSGEYRGPNSIAPKELSGPL